MSWNILRFGLGYLKLESSSCSSEPPTSFEFGKDKDNELSRRIEEVTFYRPFIALERTSRVARLRQRLKIDSLVSEDIDQPMAILTTK